VHLDGLTRPPPHLPPSKSTRTVAQTAASATAHVLVLIVVMTLAARTSRPLRIADEPRRPTAPTNITHVVFISRDQRPSGGGGGGGNRQTAPIRRAESVGHDAITLRSARPSAPRPDDGVELAPAPSVLLDARSLASGTYDILGLPEGDVSSGTSLGPGSGRGVGSGAGSGIGSGVGPGVGPGSGGGTGGGVYRPGGNVTTPRVITQVKPRYTEDALVHKIQGTVVLEMIVTKNGTPDAIRVIRPLDPGGLDAMAVDAAKQWRFEPGRLAGTPVDVLVTLMLDFRIQ